MKIYVASAYTDHARASSAADRLRAAGHTITFDWMAIARQHPDDSAVQDDYFRSRCALEDLHGVREADCVLLLTPERRDQGCGCWIEMGYALGHGIPVLLAGAQANRTIFACLDLCRRFATDKDAIVHLLTSENEVRSRLIAIDFDDTWTADPLGFRMFVESMTARGHRFVCITARNEFAQWTSEVRVAMEPLMPVLFTNGKPKRAAAEAAGYKVDIWIDDMPEMILR